jgi:hypothetical protein
MRIGATGTKLGAEAEAEGIAEPVWVVGDFVTDTAVELSSVGFKTGTIDVVCDGCTESF